VSLLSSEWRPLILTVVVFVLAAVVLPLDIAVRRVGFSVAIIATQLLWIAYRSNPDSLPVIGNGLRLKRIQTLATSALLGAAIGAVALIIVNVAGRERGMRVADAAAAGALLGAGAGLAMWERRESRTQRVD